MARCHECNSQLGENDLFCPFCGARIQASTEPEHEDISDTAPTDPGMPDVPVPDILANFSRTSDNVAPEPTSEYSFDADKEIAELDSEAKTAEEEIPEIAREPAPEPAPEAPAPSSAE